MHVYVASYQHKHGDDLRLFATDEGAQAWRNEIAATYWRDIMECEIPDDATAAGNMYFERSEELGDEFFNVVQLPVEGLPFPTESPTAV